MKIGAIPGRDIRPAEDGDRQQPRREPGVEHIARLRDLVRTALGAYGWICPRDRYFVTYRALPCWDAMPPPELPRDAPVVNVLHPVQVCFRVHLGGKTDV